MDKEPMWLRSLYRADPTAAVTCLNRSARTLCPSLCGRVEDEYNLVCENFGLPRLAPGELGTLFSALRPRERTVERVIRTNDTGSMQRRTFYYIAAGIGCGMKEIEQVSRFLYTMMTFPMLLL